jgi:hypothetical protein
MNRLTRKQAMWLNRGTSIGGCLHGSALRASTGYCTEVQGFVSTAVTWATCRRAHGCSDTQRCELRSRFQPD